ncbi:hypothetical protein [Streptomyces eurocidicus]|uniref:Putative membrane protein n=1 Tax=Streptomyces eurocidicus TaxID=66423 RepID=A0A7W8BC70_STREU|nr:hypothetical protein [Streptomyces eurocidicus]MBB5120697.1 putative membrane protein [Streptomyces eurocidicus]MBF6050382.1 hypothetical protein [Streptomyces eurocidicus]
MQSFTDPTGLTDPNSPSEPSIDECGDTGRRPPAGDSLPVLAGAAAAIAGTGAVLALADIGSALRAPLTLFFLIVAPACAVGAALRGLDPLSRSVVAVGGAVAVDLLIAQTMLALHVWTVRGGVAAVAAVSLLLFLLAHARRHRGRTERSRTS